MTIIAKRALCAIAVICAACSASAPVAFAPDELLKVAVIPRNGEARRFSLSPDDARYAQLQKWLRDNQSGWVPYPATEPGFGVFISGADLRLQFLESTVLACHMKGACLQKATRDTDYSFLLK